MITFLFNILLALVWMALTGQFNAVNFALGFVLSYAALWLIYRIHGSSSYFWKTPQFLRLSLFALREIIKANLNVAYIVLNPGYQVRPGIIAVPMDARTDAEITLLANLITLTPGTLSIDISADRKVLYVHSIDIGDDPDQLRRKIKDQLERRILEVTR
ncbi:MAG: Na+/H+ antiporter subunit E [Candidatus Caldarchaeum sp.]